MKTHYTFAIVTVLFSSTLIPAQASDFSHKYQLCMAWYKDATGRDPPPSGYGEFGTFENWWRKENGKLYGPGCRQWAAHPNPNELAEFERAYGNHRKASVNNDAAAIIITGLASGFLGGMISNQGGGAARTPQAYSRQVGLRPTVRSPANQSLQTTPRIGAPIVQRSGGLAGSQGRAGTPLGYIRGSNGQRIPYYRKRPCLTTVQTGLTSYACTNY